MKTAIMKTFTITPKDAGRNPFCIKMPVGIINAYEGITGPVNDKKMSCLANAAGVTDDDTNASATEKITKAMAEEADMHGLKNLIVNAAKTNGVKI